MPQSLLLACQVDLQASTLVRVPACSHVVLAPSHGSPAMCSRCFAQWRMVYPWQLLMLYCKKLRHSSSGNMYSQVRATGQQCLRALGRTQNDINMEIVTLAGSSEALLLKHTHQAYGTPTEPIKLSPLPPEKKNQSHLSKTAPNSRRFALQAHPYLHSPV